MVGLGIKIHVNLYVKDASSSDNVVSVRSLWQLPLPCYDESTQSVKKSLLSLPLLYSFPSFFLNHVCLFLPPVPLLHPSSPLLHIRSNINLTREASPRLCMKPPIRVCNLQHMSALPPPTSSNNLTYSIRANLRIWHVIHHMRRPRNVYQSINHRMCHMDSLRAKLFP